jgi:hypothetical protein
MAIVAVGDTVKVPPYNWLRLMAIERAAVVGLDVTSDIPTLSNPTLMQASHINVLRTAIEAMLERYYDANNDVYTLDSLLTEAGQGVDISGSRLWSNRPSRIFGANATGGGSLPDWNGAAQPWCRGRIEHLIEPYQAMLRLKRIRHSYTRPGTGGWEGYGLDTSGATIQENYELANAKAAADTSLTDTSSLNCGHFARYNCHVRYYARTVFCQFAYDPAWTVLQSLWGGTPSFGYDSPEIHIQFAATAYYGDPSYDLESTDLFVLYEGGWQSSITAPDDGAVVGAGTKEWARQQSLDTTESWPGQMPNKQSEREFIAWVRQKQGLAGTRDNQGFEYNYFNITGLELFGTVNNMQYNEYTP